MQGTETAGAGRSAVTIYVCRSCRRASDEDCAPRAGERLAAALVSAADAATSTGTAGGPVVVAVDCLSVCKRPVTIGFAAAGKWTYVYGDFDPEDANLILSAAGQYLAAPEGLIPWRERPEALKRGVVARIPPLPFLQFMPPEAAE